jgi:hypothetical protein
LESQISLSSGKEMLRFSGKSFGTMNVKRKINIIQTVSMKLRGFALWSFNELVGLSSSLLLWSKR